MDPLDQRLTDAGAAWRRTQLEPPDLDRLVRGLDTRRSRGFQPRLALVFVTGALLLGALAVVSGGGGLFRGVTNTVPVPTSTPAPSPSQAPSTPEPTAQPSPAERVTALINDYEAALVAGEWQTAFDMLEPSSPTRSMGLDAFAAERAPYYESVAGRYTLGTATRDVPDWTTFAPLIQGADVSRAYLIEVDYPALAGNNAGFEQFVVGPDASGTWWIWPVR
jgi:hypothetical protein